MVLMNPNTLPSMDLEVGDDGRARCPWARGGLYRSYHDEEWGVPLHGDRALFEKLTLEGFQSGLSWIVILRKREAFRRAFAGFDPAVVAAFTDPEVERLLADADIVRNRLKIGAAITNARALVALRDRDGEDALDRLVWSFADAAQAEHVVPRDLGDLPAATSASKALARTLKREGFVFVGPITVYSLMQSGGLVDDHLAGCWRAGGSR